MELLTVEEVAQILKLHPVTVRDWLRAGKLKGVKISRREWRIPREALEEFVRESQPGEGKDPAD